MEVLLKRPCGRTSGILGMSNRNKGWINVTLGDIGSTYSGLSGKSGEDFGVGEPYITYLQVFTNKSSNPSLFGKVKIDSSESQSLVNYGDILFTTSSETYHEVGMPSVYLNKDTNPHLNSFCFGFRPNSDDVLDPKFANYYLRSDEFRRKVFPLAQGSTRFNLSKKSFLKLSLDIPPVKEQKSIASVLASVDAAIGAFELKLLKLDDVNKATLMKLMSQGIKNTEFSSPLNGGYPKSWTLMTCGEICDRIFVGIATSTTHAYTDNKGVPILRNQNIGDGEILSDDLLYITQEFSLENSSKKLKIGDVISARTGYPGISAVVDERFDGCHTFTTLISRVNPKIITPEFYCLFMNSPIGKEAIKKVQAGGAQQNLNVEMLKKIKFGIPPLEEQIKIVGIMNSIGEGIRSTRAKRDSFLSIKKGLMQDLLTGKVRVPVN